MLDDEHGEAPARGGRRGSERAGRGPRRRRPPTARRAGAPSAPPRGRRPPSGAAAPRSSASRPARRVAPRAPRPAARRARGRGAASPSRRAFGVARSARSAPLWRPRSDAPTTAFSRAVSCGKTPFDCNVRTRPRRARRAGGSIVTSSPSSRTRPASARTVPASTRSAVVFPEPFGPTSATTRPGSSSRSNPSRAWTPPKRFAAPRTSSARARDRGRRRRSRAGAHARPQPRRQGGDDAVGAGREHRDEEQRGEERREPGRLTSAEPADRLGRERERAEEQDAHDRPQRARRPADEHRDEQQERQPRAVRARVRDPGELDVQGARETADGCRAGERAETQPTCLGSERGRGGGTLGRGPRAPVRTCLTRAPDDRERRARRARARARSASSATSPAGRSGRASRRRGGETHPRPARTARWRST